MLKLILGVSTFEYDANGNLKKLRKNASLIAEYEYDSRNQLIKVTNAQNQTLASFDYDFERKRLSKTGSNGYQSYVYAGSQIVNEFNAFGTQTAKYTIGAGEVVKSEFGANENNYHFTDALGSVKSLAKLSDGSLTSRNEYNAFGEISTNGSSANSIGYTGQRLDNETGLMALGNGERYYSPAYARFIQQDSFSGVNSIPQSLNRFAYTHNNPLKHTDPSGNVIPLILGAILIGAAIGAVVGAGFGAAYSITKQQAEIADGIRKPEDFSWSQVGWDALKGGAFGAAMGGLYASGPIGAGITIALGVVFSGHQIYEGFNERAKGKTYSGNTDIGFGILSLLLSAKGAKDTLAGRSAAVKETEFAGTKSTAIEEATQPQKLLGDGDVQERINAGRLLPERSSLGNNQPIELSSSYKYLQTEVVQ